MSEEVERKVVELLPDVSRSPFGNPIPGLSELGVEVTEQPDSGVRAIDLKQSTPVRARIVQINEILQVDAAQFRALNEVGIVVGAQVDIVNKDFTVTITTESGATVELSDDLAHAVRVEKIDA